MKAPRSRRSELLRRACWVFLIGQAASLLIEWVFDLSPITNKNHPLVFYVVGIPLGAVWVAVAIAYFVSRINDGLEQEARERRAAARQTYSPSP